jgi:FMN-dependent oxidoreductase (nitrilotriacetate monooxygenase family)
VSVLRDRYIHLNANLLPGAISDPATGAHPFIDIEDYVQTARLAEAAGFDAVFLSDALAVQPDPRNGWNVALDPFTILGALSRETTHIGLVATASTTYSAPYALARAVLSIDHISHGRAGWNVITTMDPAASRNFGVAAHPDRAERYRRAIEFTAVVRELWGSWPQDLNAHWDIDHLGYQPIDHHGEFYAVAGPMQIPASRQGLPVLFQAGGSDDGIELAATFVDAVFSVGIDEDASRAYRSKLNLRSRELRGTDVLVLPGLGVVIGSTDAEVERLLAEADAAVGQHDVERIANRYGLAPDRLGSYLDEPMPDGLLTLDPTALGTSWQQSVGFAKGGIALAARERNTLRRFISVGGGLHRRLFGTPESIADELIGWVERGAADGFNLHGFDLGPFVREVVPLLRARGVLRTEYTGSTLREHLSQRPPAAAAVSRKI